MELQQFLKNLQNWLKTQALGRVFQDKPLLVEKGYYTEASPFFTLSKKLHDHLGEPRRTWERWLICLTQAPCVAVNLERFGRRCHFSLDLQEQALRFLKETGDLILLPNLERQGERKVYFRDAALVDSVIDGVGERFETLMVIASHENYPEGDVFFWQNIKKQEVDLLMSKDGEIQFALECKASDKVSKGNLKPLEVFTGSHGLNRKKSAVLYTGKAQNRAGFSLVNPFDEPCAE